MKSAKRGLIEKTGRTKTARTIASQSRGFKVSTARVRVIGSGEAFDVGLGNTSLLFQGRGLPTVLFDCGYQVPERLWMSKLHTDLTAVCFTHLHADHSFGIVPLLARFFEEGRTMPLTILGATGTEAFVNQLLNMGYPGLSKRLGFPVRHLQIAPKKVTPFEGLNFTCARSDHSILNYTIRVDSVFGDQISFAVSGDGQITESTKSLVNDVAVLFQEIYSLKPGGKGHSDLETISNWVPSSNIKMIVASHFFRSGKERLKKQIQAQRKSKIKWIPATPGLEFEL